MKPKLLFVYDMEEAIVPLWKDGLWAALQLLKRDFDIEYSNIKGVPHTLSYPQEKGIKFILGWGAFGSSVDLALRKNLITYEGKRDDLKIGLCIGGNAHPPVESEFYDVLFYETQWYREQIKHHPHIVHAFGINGSLYKPDSVSRYAESYPLWDYLTVGAFATWKRQSLLCRKEGRKFAIGQIQKGNLQESIDIIGDLLLGGVGISDMVSPESLVKFYYMADTVYIPADINGGGERAVLEARACGRRVEVESDNPKLQELLTGPIWEHGYYANQLKEGILSCLSQ